MELLLDVMCGGIVAHLRMCGHDTKYAGDEGLEADDTIRATATEEGRTIVTRDEALARTAEQSILLTDRSVEGQLAELAAAGVDLELTARPIRCGRCNGPLERTFRQPPEHAPEDRAIYQCQHCGSHFWKGSHWDDVAETLERVREGQ